MTLHEKSEEQIRTRVRSLALRKGQSPSYFSDSNAEELWELRRELARRLGIECDPAFEHVLGDYTWVVSNDKIYAQVPGHGLNSIVRIFHSVMYKRPFHTYGPDDYVRTRDRNVRNMRQSNVPKDTGRSRHQRTPRTTDHLGSITGVRGVSARSDGRYIVQFCCGKNVYHYGSYGLQSLGVAKLIGRTLFEQFFSQSATELLSQTEIDRACIQVVNAIRSEHGLRPYRPRGVRAARLRK